MNWLAALGLALGIALLVAGFVIALAYANTHPAPTREQPATARLRAADATDHLDRFGDDDQFRRWRTLVPHIRRNANAENQTTQGKP